MALKKKKKLNYIKKVQPSVWFNKRYLKRKEGSKALSMIFRTSSSQRFNDKDNMSIEKAFEGI
jgi:hypothetical protein